MRTFYFEFIYFYNLRRGIYRILTQLDWNVKIYSKLKNIHFFFVIFYAWLLFFKDMSKASWVDKMIKKPQYNL